MSVPRVIQITHAGALSRDEVFARIERGGPGLAVQLRDPELCTAELLAFGRLLRQKTRAVGALLLVNDRLDVAVAVGADGVHLGRRSVTVSEARAFLGQCVVTCSAHSVDEAVQRSEAGVDAVLLSPIFASPGKDVPLGLAALSEARRRMDPRVALIALGGVDAKRVAAVEAAGATGVAAIRADLTAFTARG